MAGPAGRPSPPVRQGIVPVVMSGGSGTRLWPLSTDDAPKQFHSLGPPLTMIQDTVLRVGEQAGLAFAAPIIVCNRRHGARVQAQLAAIGVEPSAIVLEPHGRNTAAVGAIAARLAVKLHPGMRVLLVPADHVIADQRAFVAAVARGVAAADRIVTFGVEPTSAETGYGYIKRGRPLCEGVFEVARFTEKPKRATAERYLAEGGYYWNSGMFLFAPEVLLAELSAHRPDILRTATRALAGARTSGAVIDLPADLFGEVPSESIDVALIERTGLAAVTPCDAGWADVGSWSELWRLGPHDVEHNRLHGGPLVVDTSGSLVWAEGAKVVVVGLEDMIVVAAHGAVLVMPRSRAQEVKAIVERLRLADEARIDDAAGGPAPDPTWRN